MRKTATGVTVQVRLFNVAGQQRGVLEGIQRPAANPRVFAHTIADEIHKQQRNLTGVARTKLTFSSDRDGERMKGTVDSRGIKEIYIADYDGANPRRITVNRSLNINPVWSSDGKAIAYTSYRRAQLARHLRPVHLRGHAARVAGARHRPRPQLPAGVVAGRHAGSRS